MMLALVVATVVTAEESWSPPPLLTAPETTMAPAGPPPPPAVVTAQPDGTATPVGPPPPPPPPVVAAAPVGPPPAPLSAAPTPVEPASAPARRVVAPSEEVKQQAPAKEDDGPLWQVSAFATATVPTALEGSGFLIGARGEVDVWRLGVLVTFDRTGTTPFSMSETQHWSGLGGYAVVANKWVRVRLLGGVSALSTTSATTLAPTLGATARVGWSFLGAEAAAVWTPFGAFQQLDARAELILKGGVFELHGGYRARFLDPAGSGALFTTAPLAGPHVALGLSF